MSEPSQTPDMAAALSDTDGTLDRFLQAHLLAEPPSSPIDPAMFDIVDLPASPSEFKVPARLSTAALARKRSDHSAALPAPVSAADDATHIPELAVTTAATTRAVPVGSSPANTANAANTAKDTPADTEPLDGDSPLLDMLPSHGPPKGPSSAHPDYAVAFDTEFLRPFRISPFPGTLHLHIHSVDFFSPHRAADTFFLRITIGSRTFTTPRFGTAHTARQVQASVACHNAPDAPAAPTVPAALPSYAESSILICHHLAVPVTAEGVRVQIAAIRYRAHKASANGTVHPLCEAELILRARDLEITQNCLTMNAVAWQPEQPPSMFRRVRQLFGKPLTPLGPLRYSLAYLPVDELPTINYPAPGTFVELQQWLRVRRHAYNLLFTGYLSVRRERERWVHCYVKWYGYTLYIFHPETREIIEAVGVADARPVCSPAVGRFKFTGLGQRGAVEFHCDTSEKYDACMDALSVLFQPEEVRAA